MSTLSMPLEGIQSGAADAEPSSGLFARLIAARETKANRQVLSYLASQSDARLAALGYGADDIAALRKGELRTPSAR